MALLRWLDSQTDEDRKLLAAVTSIQVGKELLDRITNQDKVDAHKVPAWFWGGGYTQDDCVTTRVCLCVSSETVHSGYRPVPP